MNRKRELYRVAVDMFVEMMETITGRRFDYKCNDADTRAFQKFIDAYSTYVIGAEWIKKYLEYQFQSWFNQGTDRDYTHAVRFSWMFGEKAMQRWNKFDPDFNRKIVQGHIKKLGIYKPKVRSRTRIPELILRVRDVEEKFKSAYHNTRRGFAWCLANTTLFNHRSSWCVRCAFKKDCRDILKNYYPRVYVKRGYGKK